jgi:hypothetical protein
MILASEAVNERASSVDFAFATNGPAFGRK